MYPKYMKRFLDFIFALFLFILLLPVMAILWIIIRIRLGSPALFTQDRPGYHEKIFKLYKFRGMTNEKDAEGNLLPDEKRLTKLGKFLRSTSLDELPELWNILKGDMSFIGPRPLLVQYLPLYNEEQKHRHDVKPGLTGLAQVNGRNAITWEEKFRYDIEYVNRISFWTDCKILFKTIFVVFSKKGVYANNQVAMDYFTGTPSNQEKK